MKRLLLTLSVVTVLTSCAVQTTIPTYTELSTRVLEPEQKMLLTPVIADLKISDEKIHYSESVSLAGISEVTPSFIQSISELKKIVLCRAARAYNADVLVAPTIDVVTQDNKLEISVSGFPAYYTKIRNVTSDDVELLKVAYGSTAIVPINDCE